MCVITRHENNVGFVEINNTPVNALGLSVRKGLMDAVQWAEKLKLERVIVYGSGGNFSAGADISEFDSAPVEPQLPHILNTISDSIVPWIAAIDGVALGGGAELALACRMRLMTPNSRIGLPEVTLGIIPGAGGTQRLPRLVGAANALDMIATGKPIDAQTALRIGLVHSIDEDVQHSAFMVNSEELSYVVPAQDLPAPVFDVDVFENARKRILNRTPGQNAPVRAIEVIEQTLYMPIEQGSALERKAFLELGSSQQAKALRHIFFAEHDAKLVGVCDGVVGNRILARYSEAADTVFMDGSTPWDIDEAMVEFGYAMGPYTAQDLSGLDIAHANRRRQDATRDPDRRYIPIADRMVELGKLGRKTGAGWYRYPGGNGRVDDPIVADLGIEEAHFAGIKRVDYTADEIRERLLLAMINEACDILHEGIAHSASDIDLVTVFGYGFPRWRGGLMHYADTLGVQMIVSKLKKLGNEDPIAWKISPLLLHCEANDIALREVHS